MLCYDMILLSGIYVINVGIIYFTDLYSWAYG